MLRSDDLSRRLAGLRSRAEGGARRRLDDDKLDALKRVAGAAGASRRRLERLRAGSDEAYAEHLIARAIRRGRQEQASDAA